MHVDCEFYISVNILLLILLSSSVSAITIFFPAMIGILMSIRAFVLPKFFSEEEFVALGDPTPHRRAVV